MIGNDVELFYLLNIRTKCLLMPKYVDLYIYEILNTKPRPSFSEKIRIETLLLQQVTTALCLVGKLSQRRFT